MQSPSADIEHYVTLFDHKFLPQGLALYASLVEQGSPCKLWVICMDELVHEQLTRLALPHLDHVPVRELETDLLRAVKATRGRGEYCWTLTPFSCSWVLAKGSEIKRVTYVDADLFFYQPPSVLFYEWEQSAKSVLLTDHGFDPQFAHLEKVAGRFCVQFMVFRNNPQAKAILRDWEDKSLAACPAKPSKKGDLFGNQKYLDQWPTRFRESVYITRQIDKTLAPWNVNYYMTQAGKPYFPTFYHFHSFRILGPRYARLSGQYRISKARHIYQSYLSALSRQVRLMKENGISLPWISMSSEKYWVLRNLKRWLFQRMVIRKHHLLD